MPPSNFGQAEDWTHSDELLLPRQILSVQDAEEFLNFLFSDVAIKPGPLKLRQTAGVARYLRALVFELPVGRERTWVGRLLEIIWLTLLDRGQIPMAEKGETIQFLNEHSKTYLNSLDMEQIVQLIKSLDKPTKYTFRPPRLIARGRSVQGQGRAQLQDDLTERIYVAYYALRRVGVKKVRNRIAQVLNRFHLKTRADPGTDQAWTPNEVYERVRQFEDRLMQPFARRPDRRERMALRREILVDSWIYQFHFASEVEARHSNHNQKV